jgi:hypothetical protein
MPNINSNIMTTLYGFEKTSLDYTGEIKEKNNITVTQTKRKDDFLKLFVFNLDFISTNLENSEKTVLFLIISNMNFKNIVNINSDLRAEIVHKSKIHRNTISKAISSLVEKNIIYKLDSDELREKYDVYAKNSYLVNPDLIGEGSFRDLKNLKQTVITNFDFETLQMKKQITRETKYNDYNEFIEHKQNYEVKEVSHNINHKNNIKNTNILIGKKEDEELGAFWLAGGSFSGIYDKSKSAKELKRELLDEEYRDLK